MGKGWAKGLTAATDPRVARMAEAHRGLMYVRRTPIEQCRWPNAGRTSLAIGWSAEMAYLVGLTATDGCLLSGRRTINFKSADRELVATYLGLLGRTNRIHDQRTKAGRVAFHTQFSDARLYEWLRSIGLSPRKSLTLGPLAVPDEFLLPVARGLLDGDGSVINKRYRADTGRRDDYYWEYLITRFTSASRPHLEWLAARIAVTTGCVGRVFEAKPHEPYPSRHPFFHLTYGKRASIALLPLLYPANAPCLERKRLIWLEFQMRNGPRGGNAE